MHEAFDHNGRYFPTKKALKDRARIGMTCCSIQSTSAFGNEFSGYLEDAPDGRYTIVGPTAFTRRWFATVTVKGGKVTVS
jgi:hypothetical protein